MKKLTIKEFKTRANKKHNNIYNYDQVIYVNNSTKVIITCLKHGNFTQQPNAHMMGQGCNKCNNGVKYTLDDFIKIATEKHGDKYDYSKSIYIDSFTKIKIICKEHGVFEQTPGNHTIAGHDCPICSGVKKYTQEEFIQNCTNIHNNKYDYSLVEYVSMEHWIKIICPEHGLFEQKSNNHFNLKQGCINCSHSKKGTTESFIEKSIIKHGNKYDYSKVNYKGSKKPVEIICLTHGLFFQQPTKHLMMQGCPICKTSHGEKKLIKYFSDNNIEYKYQFRLTKCPFVFDFYLPKYNTIIEYDGKQHFEPVKFFGGEDTFMYQIERDSNKESYCESNNLILIRIPYYDDKNLSKYLNQFLV